MIWLDGKLRKYKLWRRWRGLPEPRSAVFDEITREALRVAHEHLRFWQTNEHYPDAWGKAKSMPQSNKVDVSEG